MDVGMADKYTDSNRSKLINLLPLELGTEAGCWLTNFAAAAPLLTEVATVTAGEKSKIQGKYPMLLNTPTLSSLLELQIT
jgi:hypothetical protein